MELLIFLPLLVSGHSALLHRAPANVRHRPHYQINAETKGQEIVVGLGPTSLKNTLITIKSKQLNISFVPFK